MAHTRARSGTVRRTRGGWAEPQAHRTAPTAIPTTSSAWTAAVMRWIHRHPVHACWWTLIAIVLLIAWAL